DLPSIFLRQGYEPPGVVVASAEDPAWTAAVALAAGRAQPLSWVDGDYRRPDNLLSVEDAAQLIERTTTAVAATGYGYAALGDAIDAITVCRRIGGRVRENPLPASRFTLPDASTAGPVATTDVLGRHPDGSRYAFVGWIFGDEARAAYAAMCSLFLSRSRVMLFNTYGDHGHWEAYGLDVPSRLLREMGYEVRGRSGPRANALGWRRLLPGGLETDLLMLNTQGMADAFDLQGASGRPQDVPLLATPLALHMVHSWSLRSPEALGTVGGQWVRHGVYAYVGSVQEPFLTAFVTPDLLARRLASHVPLLVAARQWNGPLAGPWRVQTIGDPLMLCAPPATTTMPPRLAPSPHEGIDLVGRAEALMRGADAGDAEDLADALRTLSLVGRDDVALQLWDVAIRRGWQATCAGAVLETLFRLQQASAFLDAWSYLDEADERQRDMLWHLVGTRLGPSTDDETLLVLREAMRGPRASVDLERLAPHLLRAFGQGFVRGVIRREIDRTRSPSERAALQALMKEY
ncbi:MAG: hypothetical protein ACYTJ0_06275, partial [Planctomycetota bacterium]